MTALATTTETWGLVVGLAASVLVLIVPAVILAWVLIEVCVSSDSYDAAITDVQRFVDLTERSRDELRAAPRLPLFDPDGAAAAGAAINRALELKDAARRELWSGGSPSTARHAGKRISEPEDHTGTRVAGASEKVKNWR